jgi:hypothetical protein
MDRSFLVNQSSPDGNVVALMPRSSHGVFIERSGERITEIMIVFPRRPGDTSPYESTRKVGTSWLEARHLAEPFAEALYAVASSGASNLQYQKFMRVKQFFDYLAKRDESGIALNNLDDRVYSQFISYLDTMEMNDTSRALCLSTHRAIVDWLKLSDRWRGTLSPHLRIRPNPWPGRSQRTKAREGVSIADLVAIEKACLREMGKVLAQLDEGERLIAEGRLLVGTVSQGDARLPHILARIEDEFGGCIKERLEFKIKSADLNAIREAGGFDGIERYLHATPRTLMPFIIMLAVRTAFNSETVLLLDRSAFRPSPLMPDGVEVDGRDGRHRIVGRKNRAKVDQVRTYPVDDVSLESPVTIIKAVERLTKRLRPYVDLAERERLFICLPKQVAAPRGFKGSNDWPLLRALDKFIAENGLRRFTLSELRPAISELVDRLSDGDIKAQQAVLNHWSEETTDRHYVSEQSRRRRTERLAEIQNGRERFILTDGRSDRRNLSAVDTARAVTIGFECADPYASPIQGQTAGRLCSAWGRCPCCPMASVNARDHVALAHLNRLAQAIDDARLSLHPARWLAWAQVQASVRDWINRFSDAEVVRKAAHVRLPPLAAIE